jgi:hypothetical protein
MKRSLRIAGLSALTALAAQGCARGPETAPSYLGFPGIADLEDTDAPAASPHEPRPELRHVASNKVLGAMAFQKTTGRAIDPERLKARR